MNAVRALALTVILAPLGAHAGDPPDSRVVNVKAYFVGWEVLTRVRLLPDNVIRQKVIYFEINDPGLAANFVEWLPLSKMRDRASAKPEDARLVIQLSRENGDVTTLYASKAELLTADSSRSVQVDDQFRRRFDLARRVE